MIAVPALVCDCRPALDARPLLASGILCNGGSVPIDLFDQLSDDQTYVALIAPLTTWADRCAERELPGLRACFRAQIGAWQAVLWRLEGHPLVLRELPVASVLLAPCPPSMHKSKGW